MSKFKYPAVCPVCGDEVEPTEIDHTQSVKGYDISCFNCDARAEIWLYSDEVSAEVRAKTSVTDILIEEGEVHG